LKKELCQNVDERKKAENELRILESELDKYKGSLSEIES
jgi:hypothetical protein